MQKEGGAPIALMSTLNLEVNQRVRTVAHQTANTRGKPWLA